MTAMTQEEKSKQLYEKLLPLLQNGNEVEIYPSGTSMFPLINPPNDSVVLRSIKDTRLKSGDIILYRRESGLLVLHRLCRIRQDGYYFTGDNQTELEGPLQKSQLLAIVTRISRSGHTFSVKHPIYKFCSRLWLMLRPVRPLISRPLGTLWRRLHPPTK